MLTHSDACERNKEPILSVLRGAFACATRVLEIGSGTGQHAVHFARGLPWLTWQPTDRAAELESLADRVRLQGPPNLLPPIELDVRSLHWPVPEADAVFSANTLHIMGWPEVEAFFAGLPAVLTDGGVLVIYGPFRYGGRHTSESNESFDEGLRTHDPASGIRDFEAVDALAQAAGLALAADHVMPANNRTLVWKRTTQPGAA